MAPELASVALGALGWAALFQAAGATWFVLLFAPDLEHDRAIRALGRYAACAAVLLLALQQLLQPCRLVGDYSGLWNAPLQRLAWSASGGRAHALQLLALALTASLLPRRAPAAAAAALIAVLAFTLTGHTSVHPQRWLLAPLLAVHLIVVAFWFGALLPLWWLSARANAAPAARILQRFSSLAGWSVPLILIAGVLMGIILAPDWSVLARPYGELLLLKLAAFALLMLLAAWNRWRLLPALAAAATRRSLRLSIGIEYAVIIAVLALTAVLTTFFGPEG